MSEPTEEHEEPQIDESAIRRRKTMGGMWNGMRIGALAGGAVLVGIVGLGLSWGLAAAAFGVALPFKGAALGSIGGPWGAVAGFIGGLAAAVAGGGLAASVMPTLAGAVTIGLGIVAAGAVIGGLIGAMNAYSRSEGAVEDAYQAETIAANRREAMRIQQQQKEQQLAIKEAQLAQEKEQLLAGNLPSPQNFPGGKPIGNTGPGQRFS